MGKNDDFAKRVQLLVARALLESSTDENPVQLVRVSSLADDSQEDVENVQPYGLSYHCPPGGECVLLAIQGNKEDAIAVQIGFSKARPVDLEEGEVMLWSVFKGYLKLRNDDKMEVGGNADNAVRYSKLEAAFNQLRDDFNALVSTFNAHTQTVSGTVAAAPATPGVASAADITQAKIEEVLVP